MTLPLYAKIDLTTGQCEEYPIPEAYFRRYIGGKALAARLLLDLTPAGLDPFDPRSVVIVNTGPLNGTGAPSSSRFNLSSKNVLTGGIASSNCGGLFGVMLRHAGYEGLIITGKAEKPCRIDVTDGEITIVDAAELWGLDTEKAQEELPKHVGKLVIGPSGEHLVRYAGLASGERMAGRCGVGAVFGSKNLKAVTAYGTRKIPVEHPEKFYKFVKKWVRFLKGHAMTGDALPHYGSAGLVNKANAAHALPTLNFQQGVYDKADEVSGETLAETKLTRNGGCVSCPIRCERRVMVDGREVKGPEYETLGFFGPNIGAHDLDAVIRLNYVCDILGLDTISAASTLAFAMELKQRGIKDFGVTFGDVSNLEEVLGKIAVREGEYSELANGSKWLSQKYGGADYAMHAKGLEMASYEPRRSVGMGLGYATSNRGGCHLNGGYMALLESVGVLSIRPQDSRAKAEWTVFMQNALEAISTGGCCLFSGQTFVPQILFMLGPNHWITRLLGKLAVFTGPVVRLLLAFRPLLRFNTLFLLPHAEALRLATGFPIYTGSFLDLGDRCYTVERIYNLREGLTEKDDALPKRLTHEQQVPGRKDTVVRMDRLLPQYYKTRGWDPHSKPKRRTLKRLGMEELWQP
ncbi:MAG: aldehyde ferredoxin oxidoreductase family protein [Oscillospiraceae bacterium]|jgi:aldehyde:ferredoxin oxidoreductase|nr:aldehyde ferredoxin oxidoreductase family protein [Oscillospiraceae bacterium]